MDAGRGGEEEVRVTGRSRWERSDVGCGIRNKGERRPKQDSTERSNDNDGNARDSAVREDIISDTSALRTININTKTHRMMKARRSRDVLNILEGVRKRGG